MSAFVISDKTMHRCVSAFSENKASEDCDEIGRNLFKMNNDAVESRYQDRHPDTFYDPEKYRYRVMFPDKLNQVKALHCLRYQCSEGDVPECDLYKELESKIREIESRIVHSLPEYEALPWDFEEVTA